MKFLKDMKAAANVMNGILARMLGEKRYDNLCPLSR